MSYLIVEDLKLGMDRRKKRISGQPGALWLGVNGHITRGGDFERRKKFVEKYSLPANTHGLAALNNQLYVFGHAATPGGMPPGVSYQRNQHIAAATMTELRDKTTFSGKLYTVAEFSNGDVFHYYDGVRVTSWDAIATTIADNSAIATSLAAKIDREAAYTASAVGAVLTITAATPGTPYTIATNAANFGATNDQTLNKVETQANVAAVAEVRATTAVTVTAGTSNPGVNKLNSLTVDGVNVLGAAVDWATSHSVTAANIAAQINSFNSVPEYTATAVGPIVTIRAAAGTGAGPNGFIVGASVGGDVVVSGPGTMSGGVTVVTALAQINEVTVGGTFEALDVFTVTLDGVDFIVSGAGAGTGITALTFQQKVYSVTQSLLYFSALNAPTQWGSGTGNGFINMANQNEGNEPLVGVQEYQGKAAIFSRNSIRIWAIDVDPALNAFQQTVQNSGALSNRSIIPYGNVDVFYLNDSGVRSLRARNVTDTPAVNDVGVSIDSFLQEFMQTLSETQIQRACALIEPLSGRYWLAIEKRIFVFSYFPGSKINAWTYYDLEDEIAADISDMVRINNQVYIRAGDKILLYGGDSGVVYPEDDEAIAEVALPFLSAGTPATFKGLNGFDLGIEGEWKAYLLCDPARPDVELEIGTFNRPTFSIPKVVVQMPTALFSLRLQCRRAGYACLTNMAVHYKSQKAA